MEAESSGSDTESYLVTHVCKGAELDFFVMVGGLHVGLERSFFLEFFYHCVTIDDC